MAISLSKPKTRLATKSTITMKAARANRAPLDAVVGAVVVMGRLYRALAIGQARAMKARRKRAGAPANWTKRSLSAIIIGWESGAVRVVRACADSGSHEF